ncbi:GNAT family N-acetyltransferase [Streptomyces sp. P9(2023)]|uniref:GNAT family N-acetyltransferase n=1 Tax=Streptomyces sp. P9(2023) TaxID=3064394 RepID=UPI0028F434BD|nr:GNAT family N-acetyltransferase [Streptomyces sp. P9(2023)]MDT9689051.1 GNAT family N-acetyltransferase [Streptomyces sp. P9(2023)]
MPELVTPTARLHRSWLEAHAEWNPGARQAGAGIGLAEQDAFAIPEVFAAWVRRLREQADPTRPLGDGRVHATHWWIVEDEAYVGAIDLRHRLNDFLLRAAGHVGYSIRPSARRRGLATWALGAVLPEARALGLDRVLVTCDEDNIASARAIERNGGVLEDTRDTEIGRKRRYWIAL